MLHGTYIGKTQKLIGKTALLRRDPNGLLAQFDDRTIIPYSYGWHLFEKEEFVVDPPVNFDDYDS